MSQSLKEYEGVWEEILSHSDEFAGHHVQIKIVEPPAVSAELSPKQQQMLAALREIQQTQFTPEEQEILDGFEAFRKEHPVRFCTIEDAP